MRSTSTRTLAGLLAATLAAVSLAACGGGPSSDTKVTLQYSLWVDTQVPAYQQCADAFTKKNPNITVKISQTAWDQYWTNLTTQVVSGDAPDVFRNSILYYPKFVANNQILDISSYVERDKVDLGQYQTGLADVWVRDGKRYGLPVDWDTIAVVYNSKLLAEAGVDPKSLANSTWNPVDGGTFGKAIAALTVDDKGRKGTDPGFDKDHVKVYGLAPDYATGSLGQTSWGNFAVSNGFSYVDKNPFGTTYYYDSPKLAETISWFGGLIDKGYAPRYDKQSALGGDALLQSGKAALAITGSWMAKTYLTSNQQKLAFAPLPIGPEGRKSAINGLSDAIYAGTKYKEEAWKWVSFVGSKECQDLVAKSAVVFPAIKSSSDIALAAHQAAGRDVQVFVDEANAPDGTFLLPITDNGDKINEIMQTAIDTVWLRQADAQPALSKANQEVNALFK